MSVTTIEGRKDYDLYISSEHRKNAFVNLGPSFDVANCSPFELLYKNNQDTYESLINKFKNMQEPNQLLFFGNLKLRRCFPFEWAKTFKSRK